MERIDGGYLRHLREERGWSLREFAERVYASKSSVQRWEQSALPENADTVARVAEVFGMTTDELRAGSRDYTEKKRQAKEEDEWTPEQLAEMKFGTKKLLIALGIVVAAVVVLALLPAMLL